jgi:hypothetical protein
LKLKYGEPLLIFAFKFNLRRYAKVIVAPRSNNELSSEKLKAGPDCLLIVYQCTYTRSSAPVQQRAQLRETEGGA